MSKSRTSRPAGESEAAPERPRCAWCLKGGPLDIAYHDNEWGVPVHDDRTLFELLTLEGAQAGLSWTTILKKREGYRKAFAEFDVARVARFTTARAEKLLADPGIVRNRLKVASTITNAQAFLAVQREFGSFGAYLWAFTDHQPIRNAWTRMAEVPASTPLSDRLSKDLSRRDFRFVGTTIMYAFMQAVGMVNDHTTDCFRWGELSKAVGRAQAATRPKT